MANKENIINSESLRTIVDGNTDAFRYGIFKYEDSQFEDPTYLGFTIELDTNTALFKEVAPFLEKHGKNRIEHNSRIPVYNDFRERIQQVFNSQESVSEDKDKSVFIKSHYINSISGLDSLSKKFIDWKEDGLEIELHEDVSLYSSYLAHLYNNLVYSYDTGRKLIPENLLKFNLYIKISEIRNLTSLAKLKSSDVNDQFIANSLKNNVTSITYKLTDCEFDFTQSRPFGNDIAQSGIDAAHVTHSVLPMKIWFKSVSRRMYAPLVKSSVVMNDKLKDLGVVIIGYTGDRKDNGQVTDPSSTTDPNYQKGQTETGKQNLTNDAFHNTSFKKSSDASTYKIETDKNSELVNDLDIKQKYLKQKYLNTKDIKDYNADHDIDPRAKNPAQHTPDKTLDESLGGFNLIGALSNPQKGISDLANSAKNKVVSVENQLLQVAKNKINQLRAQLVNQFVNEVAKNVGLKKIVPANVNDPTYQSQLLEQLTQQLGGSVLNSLGGILKQ
jgi:hypothetical protein